MHPIDAFGRPAAALTAITLAAYYAVSWWRHRRRPQPWLARVWDDVDDLARRGR